MRIEPGGMGVYPEKSVRNSAICMKIWKGRFIAKREIAIGGEPTIDPPTTIGIIIPVITRTITGIDVIDASTKGIGDH
jgi:hypothetical protein